MELYNDELKLFRNQLELLQLLHRDRGYVCAAAWEASVPESVGLGVDGGLAGSWDTAAYRFAVDRVGV